MRRALYFLSIVLGGIVFAIIIGIALLLVDCAGPRNNPYGTCDPDGDYAWLDRTNPERTR